MSDAGSTNPTQSHAAEAIECVRQGVAAHGRGDRPRAKELFARALELDKTNASAGLNLGQMFAEEANWPEMLRVYNQLLAYTPTAPLAVSGEWQAAWQLANLAINNSQWHIAHHLLRHVIRSEPDFEQAYPVIQYVINFKRMMYVQSGQVGAESTQGQMIRRLVHEIRPRIIADIGAASGQGTTAVFAQAVLAEGLECTIYALEAQEETFEQLKANTAKYPFVVPLFGSLVKPQQLGPWEEVREDVLKRGNLIAQYGENQAKAWFDYGVKQVQQLAELGRNEIPELSAESGKIIDLAMLDAGEFFAKDELQAIIDHTNAIILDDIRSYKNAYNHEMLSQHPDWEMAGTDPTERNGWSAFKRRQMLGR